jgi:hypothetical protein
MAAVAAAPDAPQRGDGKNCELLSSRCILLTFVLVSIFSGAFRSGRLLSFLSFAVKVCPLVPAKAPLPEEVIFNRNHAAAEKRRAARKTQHKNARSPSVIETRTASRGRRRGSVASPLMKIHRWSRRGVATLPARRWIGVRCRGRPCRRLLAPQKCRHHDGRRWPRAIRMWARARDKQLALPEKISEPSVPARSPAGRAPRVAKCHAPPSCPPEAVRGAAISRSPTLRWSGPSRLRLLAEAPVTGEVDGLCRRRARRRQWIPVPLRGACSRYLSRAAEPWTFTCPSSPAGAKVQPRPSQRSEDQPLCGQGSGLSPLRRRFGVEQPPSWRAPSVQPPSRARRAAR